jgi:Rad3-related DNA helicase
LFPDRSSPYVAKRRGMPDGTKWYGLKTLENTIQRLGRGVRHENDSCSSYILDPYWSRLYSEHEAEFEPLNMVWGANE